MTAEYVGCFLFLFCTIGCVVFTQDGGITTARQLEVSLVFGGMITILVYGIGPISGGNLNPAVSLALALSQKISPLRLCAYTAAQCLGAICGAGMVRIMTPALFDKVDGGANEISPNANPTESYGVEFGCTFLLVFTVMAATDGVRAKTTPHIGAIAPLVIGLAVTVAHFVAIPVDNCSINPARSFGVSAISRNWNDHHVFWCALALRLPPPSALLTPARAQNTPAGSVPTSAPPPRRSCTTTCLRTSPRPTQSRRAAARTPPVCRHPRRPRRWRRRRRRWRRWQ